MLMQRPGSHKHIIRNTLVIRVMGTFVAVVFLWYLTRLCLINVFHANTLEQHLTAHPFHHLDAVVSSVLALVLVYMLFLSHRYLSQRIHDIEALREARESLGAIIQASPLTIISMELDGRVKSWNAAAEQLFGWCEAEVIDRPIPIVPDAYQEEASTLRAAARRGEVPLAFETRRQRKDGSLVDVSISVAPLHNAGGDVCGVVAVFADISTRKQAEAAEQESKERQASMAEGLYGIMDAADELLACESMDIFLRRAVELAREKLGVERAGLYLESDDHEYMVGTYGTDMRGETIQEHHLSFPVDDIDIRTPAWSQDREKKWFILTELPEGWKPVVSEGKDGQPATPHQQWLAVTPVFSPSGRFGTFFNDTAITNAPLDEVKQDILAVYCSVLGSLLQRKKAEERQAVMAHNLREVLLVADELLACPSVDKLLRRAVELPRERLGIERCGIFFEVEPCIMQGAYGTDLQGNTRDEHHFRYPMGTLDMEMRALMRRGGPRWYLQSDIPAKYNREYTPDGKRRDIERSWHVITPILSSEQGVLGSFTNDAAITHAPVSPDLQDVLAVYCSLLGTIYEQKCSQERQATMAKNMNIVLAMADELIACTTLEQFFRRAVELPRERLGIIRCGLRLEISKGDILQGAFGTDMLGNTRDERDQRCAISKFEIQCRQRMRDENTRWFLDADPVPVYAPELDQTVKRIWVVITPVFSPNQEKLGSFYNDPGEKDLPVDADQQDILAVYCSLLGAILQRKQAEEALLSEKERLAVTLRSIGDGVIATDNEGRVVLINRIAEELTGWSQEEAAGKLLEAVFHIVNEKTRLRCESPVAMVLRTNSIVGLSNHTVLIARDGTERTIADSGAPIFDRESQIIGVILVFRDVTEQYRVEDELRRADKLESIGVLAGGIAHDFNNLLAAMMGNLSLAQLDIPPTETACQRVGEAQQLCLRARDLTQQLLTFSRGGAPVKQTASICGIVKESAAFVLTGSNVKVAFDIPDEIWDADVDAGQISQVLGNLVLNAAQAMPEGGVVTVRVENAAIGVQTSLPLPGGQYVKIEVIDEGSGIAPQHLARIFDPFYTTKPHGNGLGLATSYSIVQRHDGHIAVESREGHGSTFTVYLPASADRAIPEVVSEAAPPVSGGRILVMDDDAAVREVAVALLSAIGFDAEGAADGAETIARYQAAMTSAQPLDVVIMDLTIPGGMGGKETVAALLQIDPDVRAIVSSGYSTDSTMAEFREYGFRGVVAKPYRLADLQDAIQRVMASDTVTA